MVSELQPAALGHWCGELLGAGSPANWLSPRKDTGWAEQDKATFPAASAVCGLEFLLFFLLPPFCSFCPFSSLPPALPSLPFLPRLRLLTVGLTVSELPACFSPAEKGAQESDSSGQTSSELPALGGKNHHPCPNYWCKPDSLSSRMGERLALRAPDLIWSIKQIGLSKNKTAFTSILEE